MDRALRESHSRRGEQSAVLENVIRHPQFVAGTCITRFIDERLELFHITPRRDRATKLLRFRQRGR